MSDERDEMPLDPRIAELAKGYHRPPVLDRDAAWSAIGDRRRAAGGQQSAVGGRQSVVSPRALAWITGIAALLVIGVGIGRMTAPPVTPAATVSVAQAPSTALEFAAAQHLSQAEAYLTLFRAAVRTGQGDSLPVSTARQLLATNRLLLDSPVGQARLRPLLLDLELVLAEITQLGSTGRPADVQLITDGLDHGNVMMRLRVMPGRGSLPIGVL